MVPPNSQHTVLLLFLGDALEKMVPLKDSRATKIVAQL
jgi:hypothetical protein